MRGCVLQLPLKQPIILTQQKKKINKIKQKQFGHVFDMPGQRRLDEIEPD